MDDKTGILTHTLDQFLEKIGFTGLTSDLNVFTVNEQEKESCEFVFDDPILYPFRADYVSFILVIRGEMIVKVNLIEYTLKANDVIVFTPNDIRQFVSVSTGFYSKSVNFKPDYLSRAGIHRKNVEAMEFMPLSSSPLLKVPEKDMELLLKMTDILATKNSVATVQAYQEEVMLNVFAGFIYELGSHYKRQQSFEEIKVTRKEELVMRFMKILPLHFKTVRSVQVYASMLHISPKYLSHTLKEITGKTAGDFIDEMVMLEAKVLLNEPQFSVAQVAGMLGFSDQFFFSSYFKKHYGQSPSSYRRP